MISLSFAVQFPEIIPEEVKGRSVSGLERYTVTSITFLSFPEETPMRAFPAPRAFRVTPSAVFSRETTPTPSSSSQTISSPEVEKAVRSFSRVMVVSSSTLYSLT